MMKKILNSISEGLVHSLPVILVGSFALILRSLPIPEYSAFIQSVFNGYLYDFLSTLYSVSLGILGIVLTMSIAHSYAMHSHNDTSLAFMLSATSLCVYFILMGLDNFNLSQADGSTIFTSIVASIGSSLVFLCIRRRQDARISGYYSGMYPALRSGMYALLPFSVTLILFAVLKVLAVSLFGTDNIQAAMASGIGQIYVRMGDNLFSTLLFIVSIHLLWMCGIHGDNILYSAKAALFAPAVMENAQLVADGLDPTHIFNTTFLDAFAFMGGSGVGLALIFALLLFGKKKNLKQVAKISMVPAIFNINETLLFGIPIVLNKTFLIPFVLIPCINVVLAYLATLAGFLPYVSQYVTWTVPALLSGYLATGSIRGTIFQLVLLVIDVLIYRPFVIRYERITNDNLKKHIGELTNRFKQDEDDGEHPIYIYLTNETGSIAKMLADELLNAMAHNELQMFYQPQVDTQGKCIGAEALLRWNYSDMGYIYPPLIIELAKERNILDKLEEQIFDTVCKDLKELNAQFGDKIKLSANITGDSLKNPNLIKMIESKVQKYHVSRENLWIEITEQDAIASSREVAERLSTLNELSYHLLIDDFGMGHTSLTYLKASYFNVVKLDGSLTREYKDERYQQVISSITGLSHHLNFDVIAEYVEAEDQRDKLVELGCTGLQGYLYSPAIPLDEFFVWLAQRNA